ATSLVFCGKGILLRGPSGSGKSDFALRLVDAGGVLVSDDRSEMSVEEGALHAACPAAIAGLLEVRGVGLMRVPYMEKAKIDLCLDCVSLAEVPRLPEKAQIRLQGVLLPLFKIYALEASAVAKLRAILQYPLAHE